jgi:hypothetical protein
MANDLSGRPWYVDTPSATTLHPLQTFVKSIVFSGYASAADQAIITELTPAGNTKVVCTLQGKADLSPVYFTLGAPFWCRNIAVPTLTSGHVDIFI